MCYILPATLFCRNIGALPSSNLEGIAIHHLRTSVLVGGGLESHLGACSQYSSNPMPFMNRWPSKAAITDGSSPRRARTSALHPASQHRDATATSVEKLKARLFLQNSASFIACGQDTLKCHGVKPAPVRSGQTERRAHTSKTFTGAGSEITPKEIRKRTCTRRLKAPGNFNNERTFDPADFHRAFKRRSFCLIVTLFCSAINAEAH